jgi:hypothetical protein
MAKRELTIDDLLDSLQNPETNLPNTKKTWSRISSGDTFDELNLEPSELASFLRDWIDNNPYSNI